VAVTENVADPLVMVMLPELAVKSVVLLNVQYNTVPLATPVVVTVNVRLAPSLTELAAAVIA
jgi:hypothetical protein